MSSLLKSPSAPLDPAPTQSPGRAWKSSRLLRRVGLFSLCGLIAIAGFSTASGRTALHSVLDPVREFFSSSNNNFEQYVTEIVQRGPFLITVTEKGTIDSLRNATLTSKVEGQATIISIVPEGTHVKKGDVVCELDSSALVDKAIQQQIQVTQAAAAMETAEKEVAIQRTTNASEIDTAVLTKTLADIDLRKFRQGDYEQQKIEMESMVNVNEQNLTRAREYLAYLKRLVKKGYRMQSDLDAEQLAFSKAQNDLIVAEKKLDVLTNFTRERTEKELEAKVEEANRNIERTKIRTDSALSQKLADWESKKLLHKVAVNLHERLEGQIKACTIVATQDGQVVYANSREGRNSDSILIDVGVGVRERQPIINLPDLDSMKVNARIHESRISMIREGLTATVKVDAFPTEEFHGVVDTVASVPSSLNSFSRDLKEYEAIVRLTDDVAKMNQLRPGLNATLEILVGQKDNLLQAPVQSVISIIDQHFAYVVGEQGAEIRKLKIGVTNERMVEIVEGLEEGDHVIMNPRTQFSREIAELTTKLSKEHSQKPASEAAPPAAAPPAAPPRPDGSPGSDAPGGAPSPQRGGGGAGGDPLAFFQRMDQNQDGKLTVDELNERMKPRFETMDADKSGAIDQTEFTTAAASFRGRGGRGGGQGNPEGASAAGGGN